MREFQEKKKYKNLIYSRYTVAILAIAILFFGNATWHLLKKERESANNAHIADNELKRLEDREKLLNAEIGRLKTNQGVEEEIRAKYTVAKPGENLLIIVHEEKATTTPPAPETWWDKIKKLFN